MDGEKTENLQLVRKQLEKKISSTDKKLDRLTSILHKKLEINGTTPDQLVSTKDGYRVSDFCYHPRRNEYERNNINNDNHNDKIGIMTSSNSLIKSKNSNSAANITSKNHTNTMNTSKERIMRAAMTTIYNDNVLKRTCKHIAADQISKQEAIAKKLSRAASLKPTQPSIPQSFLPNRYTRGELPCTIEHGPNGHFLSWVCPMENLEFEYYLPIFFDGLQCKQQPVAFIARQAVEDMLFWARYHPDKIRSCIKALVRPLRNALSKQDSETLLAGLKAIQQLIKSHCGPELVPYCKQFLTPLTMFMSDEVNIGDAIDFGQRKNNCVGEQIRITLELLEDQGGPKALAAIKMAIPTYQSCHI